MMVNHRNDTKVKMKMEENQLFSVNEIERILGANLEGAPGILRSFISGIAIDSRSIKNGDLFVAIPGEKFDGHDFVISAFNNGAVAAIVNKSYQVSNLPDTAALFHVDDTVFALGELAKNHREKMNGLIIAITGSNGKTTVKNLIFHVLMGYANSIKSKGNFNNFYGLPLSLFEMNQDHQYGVFELGMSAEGEIRRLSEIASPSVAVVTNVGPAHMEFFDTIGDIAKAKLEIVENIKSDGSLIIKGDDENLINVLGEYKNNMITFGYTEDSGIYPVDLEFDENQLSSFTVDNVVFKSPLAGKHNVYNLLATIAVSKTIGIDLELVSERLANYVPEGMRSEVIEKNGIKVILDCYNANPVSTKFALDTLANMKADGRRIAVIGDMLELGEKSSEYHREIGTYASELQIDSLFSYGQLSQTITEQFGDNGKHFDDKASLLNKLTNFVREGDIILFKGSRGMALEDVAYKLMETI